MKKITTLLLAIFIVFASFAQKNLFESLTPFDGQEFKAFDIKYNSTENKFYIKESEYNDNIIINIVRNGANKPIGLDFLDATSKSKNEIISYKAHHNTLDHYTQPAYAYTDLTGKNSHLMIDDIFFAIEKANEDFSKYGLGIAYVPLSILNKKEEKTADNTEKKKVSFKDKLKNLMDAPIGGTPLPEALKQIKTKDEFKAKIDNYITAMRKKQASNPYTAQDNKELAVMKKVADDVRAGISKSNSDYWSSEEGQRVLNKDKNDFLSVYNNSGGTIHTIEEDGKTTSFFGTGRTNKYKCTTKVYYCIGCGSNTDPDYKGEFIGGGDSTYCGKTITLTK